MSTIAKLADAVVGELNRADLGEDFTASRAYRPVYDLGDMADLRVTVVPRTVGETIQSRSRTQSDYTVDVAVQKKIAGDEEADGLMNLVEAIARHFRFRRLMLLGGAEAVWIATANSPIYVPEHLAELGQFTSVLSLTFRTIA